MAQGWPQTYAMCSGSTRADCITVAMDALLVNQTGIRSTAACALGMPPWELSRQQHPHQHLWWHFGNCKARVG